MRLRRSITSLILSLSIIISIATPMSVKAEEGIATGVYMLIPQNTKGMALDVSGASFANEGNVQIYKINHSGAQKFFIKSAGGNTYTILNMNSGLALDAKGGGVSRKTNVQQYTPNGTGAQKWVFENVEDDIFMIANKKSGLYLDVAGGRTANKTNVWLYTRNDTAAQEWQLVKVSDMANAPSAKKQTAKVGGATVKYENGVAVDVNFPLMKHIDQTSTYGYYPMACGAAASLMALQANGYVRNWTTKSHWNAYINQFRKTPEISPTRSAKNYGVRGGAGLWYASAFKSVFKKSNATKNIPVTVTGSKTTMKDMRYRLSHGQTAAAIVPYGPNSYSTTHWIAILGYYKSGNTYIYRIADPWGTSGHAKNYGKTISEKTLWSKINHRVVTKDHKGINVVYFGNLKQ